MKTITRKKVPHVDPYHNDAQCTMTFNGNELESGADRDDKQSAKMIQKTRPPKSQTLIHHD